jgi:hypothetical protein
VRCVGSLACAQGALRRLAACWPRAGESIEACVFHRLLVPSDRIHEAWLGRLGMFGGGIAGRSVGWIDLGRFGTGTPVGSQPPSPPSPPAHACPPRRGRPALRLKGRRSEIAAGLLWDQTPRSTRARERRGARGDAGPVGEGAGGRCGGSKHCVGLCWPRRFGRGEGRGGIWQ